MAKRQATTRSRKTVAAWDSEFVQIAYDYAVAAVADRKRKQFCEFVQQAAKRFLDDLKRGKRRDCEFYFSEEAGHDVCEFIENLPHVQGSWDDPTLVLESAQIFILVNVFGFRLKKDDRRRFTRAYIEVARKNAKSTLTAGVALYCLTCEGELGPEIVIGATTGKQAEKVFNPAKQMVDKVSALRDHFSLKTFVRSITCGDNGGSIQPINSKSSSQDGWNPFVGILDELHAHKDRGLFDVIRSAFGARKQGTLIAFRVGPEDASILAREFAPTFDPLDLVNLQAHDIILKMMVDGAISRPFSATTLPPASPTRIPPIE